MSLKEKDDDPHIIGAAKLLPRAKMSLSVTPKNVLVTTFRQTLDRQSMLHSAPDCATIVP
jgi:hypothetical protein